MPETRRSPLSWTGAARAAVIIGTLAGAAFGSAAQADAATNVQRPFAAVCVGSPLFAAGRSDRRIAVFDPWGKKVWEQLSGRQEPEFRPEHAGTYQTIFSADRKRLTFKTRAVICSPGEPVRLNDGGVPLLAMTNAAPGETQTACVVVTYADAGPARLRLYGETSGTALERYLDLVVTRGAISSAVSGSCLGFIPDTTNYIGAGAGVIYRGALRGFPDSYAQGRVDPVSGYAHAWARNESHAYRFSVSLRDDNGAQGLSATQTFAWAAEEAPRARGLESVVDDRNRSLLGTLRGVLGTMKRLAAEAAKKGAFPLVVLLIVAAFLSVQNRIDRKDPKLALAPVYPDPDLDFRPPPGESDAYAW